MLRPTGAGLFGSFGAMKYALSLMMGGRQTYPRPPFPDVTEDQKKKIREAVEQLKHLA